MSAEHQNLKSSAFRYQMLYFLHLLSLFHRKKIKKQNCYPVLGDWNASIDRGITWGETIFFYHWSIFIKTLFSYLKTEDISKFVTIILKLKEAEDNPSVVWSITQKSKGFASHPISDSGAGKSLVKLSS